MSTERFPYELRWITALRQTRRLRREIHKARRYWHATLTANPVGVARIGGEAIVGDLPERTLVLIAARVHTKGLVEEIDALREDVDWLRRGISGA